MSDVKGAEGHPGFKLDSRQTRQPRPPLALRPRPSQAPHQQVRTACARSCGSSRGTTRSSGGASLRTGWGQPPVSMQTGHLLLVGEGGNLQLQTRGLRVPEMNNLRGHVCGHTETSPSKTGDRRQRLAVPGLGREWSCACRVWATAEGLSRAGAGAGPASGPAVSANGETRPATSTLQGRGEHQSHRVTRLKGTVPETRPSGDVQAHHGRF